MICPRYNHQCECEVGNNDVCSIPVSEFAAMVKDAERWRKFCSLDADVYINSTGESYAGGGFSELLTQYLDAMEKE